MSKAAFEALFSKDVPATVWRLPVGKRDFMKDPRVEDYAKARGISIGEVYRQFGGKTLEEFKAKARQLGIL